MDVAENAVKHFERQTQLSVVVHDLGLNLGLPDQRGVHRSACCQLVKKSVDGWRCYALEVTQLRQQWQQWPQGRIHRCHAGFIEWMVPVLWQGDLLAVLFAGQARFAHALEAGDHQQKLSPAANLLTDTSPLRVIQGSDEARDIHEQLHQLAARLHLLALQHDLLNTKKELSRRSIIDQFIQQHHHNIELSIHDLAHHLNLSTSRAAHVLQELYGESFVQLLTAARIQRACDLLQFTQQSIAQVALDAGFGDQAHFFRQFKKHLHTTPRRWRVQQDSAVV